MSLGVNGGEQNYIALDSLQFGCERIDRRLTMNLSSLNGFHREIDRLRFLLRLLVRFLFGLLRLLVRFLLRLREGWKREAKDRPHDKKVRLHGRSFYRRCGPWS